MYDYGGLRTRVNPVTGEVEYDDTPEPVAQPTSEPKAAPLRPVMPSAEYHEPDPNASAPPVAMMPRTAQPRYAPQPLSAAIQPVEPPVPGGGAAPIVPKISPVMSTAEIADPHAMAELNADPVHKRNIFSKILAGLAGAYYGSQGRIDLAQQIGQQPRLQHEQQVRELEGRYRQGNNDLQERQDRELNTQYRQSQILENEAQAERARRAPVLEPRYSTGEGTATIFDPNTGELRYIRDPNAPNKDDNVNWQTIQTENGWEQVNPRTGETRPLGAKPPAKQAPERQPTRMDQEAWLGTSEGQAAYKRAYLDEQQQIARQMGFETLDELQAAQADPDRGDAVQSALRQADIKAQRRAMQEAAGAVRGRGGDTAGEAARALAVIDAAEKSGRITADDAAARRQKVHERMGQ